MAMLSAAGRGCAAADVERLILHRVDRAVRIVESELHYQLKHKDRHPLAYEDELVEVLDGLVEHGLITAELCFQLTPEGRERLAQGDGGGGDQR